MAIEEAVLELTETINELNKLLKHGLQTNAESKKKTEATKEDSFQPALDDVRNSLIQLKEARDHKTAKAVLKSFGVQKVQDLSVKDYQRCIDLCQKETA